MPVLALLTLAAMPTIASQSTAQGTSVSGTNSCLRIWRCKTEGELHALPPQLQRAAGQKNGSFSHTKRTVWRGLTVHISHPVQKVHGARSQAAPLQSGAHQPMQLRHFNTFPDAGGGKAQSSQVLSSGRAQAPKS